MIVGEWGKLTLAPGTSGGLPPKNTSSHRTSSTFC